MQAVFPKDRYFPPHHFCSLTAHHQVRFPYQRRSPGLCSSAHHSRQEKNALSRCLPAVFLRRFSRRAKAFFLKIEFLLNQNHQRLIRPQNLLILHLLVIAQEPFFPSHISFKGHSISLPKKLQSTNRRTPSHSLHVCKNIRIVLQKQPEASHVQKTGYSFLNWISLL